MPQDLPPDDRAERTRDRYAGGDGDARPLHQSAARDAAAVVLALRHVRLAQSAVRDLARSGDLSITMELGADDSDEMMSLNLAEEGLARALETLRRL